MSVIFAFSETAPVDVVISKYGLANIPEAGEQISDCDHLVSAFASFGPAWVVDFDFMFLTRPNSSARILDLRSGSGNKLIRLRVLADETIALFYRDQNDDLSRLHSSFQLTSIAWHRIQVQAVYSSVLHIDIVLNVDELEVFRETIRNVPKKYTNVSVFVGDCVDASGFGFLKNFNSTSSAGDLFIMNSIFPCVWVCRSELGLVGYISLRREK